MKCGTMHLLNTGELLHTVTATGVQTELTKRRPWMQKTWRAAMQPNLCADGCQLLMCCINCCLQMLAIVQSQFHSQPVGLFRKQSCHSSGAKPTCCGPKPAPQAEAWQLGQARGCPHQSSGCGSDGSRCSAEKAESAAGTEVSLLLPKSATRIEAPIGHSSSGKLVRCSSRKEAIPTAAHRDALA